MTARTQRKTQARTRAQIQARTQEDEAPEQPENLFDSIRDDAYVLVQRWDQGRGKWVQLQTRLAPDEVTIERLMELAGGGRFRLQERVPDEQAPGKTVYGRQRTIDIEGPPKVVLPRQEGASKRGEQELHTGTPPGVGIDQAMTAGIINLLNQSANASKVQLEAMQALVQRPQTDWATVIAALVPLFTELVRGRDSKEPPMDPLAMVEKVTSIIHNASSPAPNFKEMIETFNEVLDVKDRVAPDLSDPVAIMAGQLPRLLDIIAKETEKRGRMPTPDEVRARLPASTQQAAPPWLPFLKRYENMLVSWAQGDKDAELAADFIAESVPDNFRGAIKEFFLRDDVTQLIYSTLPGLQAYPQWTSKCFTHLMGNFVETEEPIAGELAGEAETAGEGTTE